MTDQPQTFNQGLGILYDVEKELQDLKKGLKSSDRNNTSNKTVINGDHSHTKSNFDTVEKIELVCNKFHQVVRQMRSRYNNRATLQINDEYDVQDLFHSLLTLYFEDIRREESNPSYAGANSRSDFLLKPEQTIIEIKKTREGLKNKQLGEELTLDIQKYQAHPDCKTLICFVYDPEGRINNPRGLERDLEKTTEKIKVQVFIRQS